MILDYTSSQRLINHQSQSTKPKPKTTTMSKLYTKNLASFVSKRISRVKVANGIKETMKEGSVIHYLGGTSTQTPFENKFKNKGATFVRYERMKSIVPNGYQQVTFDNKGNAHIPDKGEKGYFVNDDFFNSFFEINSKVTGNETHLWLDFCGMPKTDLLEMLYYTFLHEDAVNFKSLYLTFFLKVRNCEDVKKNLFCNGEKTIEEKSNTLLNKFKSMAGENVDCEIFDNYMNGKSPMVVLKLERRDEIEDMAKTASVENYVKLHKRGFSNKQIAIFWKAGLMQVAGFAANAKRKKMV
jgi:hypothetical protein